MMSVVASIGNFGKNETTPKNISWWLNGIFCCLIKLTKSLVFWTVYSLLLKNSATLTKNDANTQTLNTGNAPPNTGSLLPNTANSGTPGGSVNDQNAFNNTDNVSTLLQIVE